MGARGVATETLLASVPYFVDNDRSVSRYALPIVLKKFQSLLISRQKKVVLNFAENSSYTAIKTLIKFSKYDNQGPWMLFKLILHLTVMAQVNQVQK